MTATTPAQADPAVTMRRRSTTRVPMAIWSVAVIALIGIPLLVLVSRSVWNDGQLDLSRYAELLTDPSLLRAGWNSLLVSIGTCVGVALIALPLAWLCAATDLAGRSVVRSVAVLTFAAPSFIAAMGWILLAGPRSGMLNKPLQAIFGLDSGPLNVFSLWGIIIVMSLFLYPLLFLPVVAALDGFDPSLEQAAASLGATRTEVVTKVIVPLLTPAISAGLLVTFTVSFVMFGPVSLLGGPVGIETVPIALYRLISFPPQFELAAVVAVPTLVILGALLWLQRRVAGRRGFGVVAGKHSHREVVRLGKWQPLAWLFVGAVIVVSLVLPFGVLILTGFRKAIGLPLSFDNLVFTDNYRTVLGQPQVVSSFFNSLVLAFVAVVIATVLSLLAAWLTERGGYRRLIPAVMSAPLAFPGAMLGVAAILTFAGAPLRLGGTLTIIAIVYVVRALPLTFQYTQAGLKQITPDLEEAASSLGAGRVEAIWKVTAPLLRTSLIAAALLNYVVLFRELETSIFLYTGSNETVSVVLFNLAAESRFQLMGAFATIVLAVNLTIALLGNRAQRRATR